MTLLISWSTQTFSLGDDGNLEDVAAEHSIAFDAVTSVTVEGTSVLTEHAVESGAPISDHKRANPMRVTIEAIVTNTPLDRPPASGYGNSGNVIATIVKDEAGAVRGFSEEFDRIADVLVTLDRLRKEATPVTLSTGRRSFDQVQIVSVTEPREADDGDAQRFTIEIQEVRIAQSRTVDLPTPREPRGSGRRDRGGQEGAGSSQRVSTIQAAREEYQRRRDAGEDAGSAALGAVGVAFGG